MSPGSFAAAVAGAAFAAVGLGLTSQRVLHERHAAGPARDMIGVQSSRAGPRL